METRRGSWYIPKRVIKREGIFFYESHRRAQKGYVSESRFIRAGRYPFHENPPSRWKFAFSVSRTSFHRVNRERVTRNLKFSRSILTERSMNAIFYRKSLNSCSTAVSTLQKWRNSFRDLEKGIEKGWKLVTRSRNEEGRGDSLQWGRSCFFPPFFLLSRNWFRERWR